MAFFDTLAVVTLGIRQSEQTLFEARTAYVSLDVIRIDQKLAYSFSFQKEKAMLSKPWVSDTPAIPSSPHR